MGHVKFYLDLDVKKDRRRILDMDYPDWVRYAANKFGLGGRKAYAIFKEAEKIEARNTGDLNNQLIRRGIVKVVDNAILVA